MRREPNELPRNAVVAYTGYRDPGKRFYKARRDQPIGSIHRGRRMAERIVTSLFAVGHEGCHWSSELYFCVGVKGECGEDHDQVRDPFEKPGEKSWMARRKLEMVLADRIMIRYLCLAWFCVVSLFVMVA